MTVVILGSNVNDSDIAWVDSKKVCDAKRVRRSGSVGYEMSKKEKV